MYTYVSAPALDVSQVPKLVNNNGAIPKSFLQMKPTDKHSFHCANTEFRGLSRDKVQIAASKRQKALDFEEELGGEMKGVELPLGQ
jgi:hypothetical protein